MVKVESPVFTTKEAAEYLKVSPSWLERDRRKKKPTVPFLRLGSQVGALVRYNKSDLDKYLKSL